MNRSGYTLAELMITIAIMATIFATVVLVGINPSKQFKRARDESRKGDVNTILGGIYFYAVNSQGRIPTNIPSIDAGHICKYGYGTSCEEPGVQSGVNLDVLVDSGYVVDIPSDPQLAATSSGTMYEIIVDSLGLITVTAQTNEGTEIISATR